MNHRTVLPATALVLGLALAGCSSTSTGSTPGTGPSSSSSPALTAQPGVVFNDADVTFLTGMYPHHAQALEMATMVEGRSTTQSVIDLATRIKAEQQPEMDTITSLLARFGKPAPSTAMSGMGSSGMSGMSGMMTGEDMSKLGTLSGTEFNKTWLTMMTEHHAGAVDLAKVELARGSNADAKTLATNIIAAQQAELTLMKGLLAQP